MNWVNKRLPINVHGKDVYLRPNNVLVSGAGPSMLFATVQLSGSVLDIVVAHAPHSGTKRSRRKEWWATFRAKPGGQAIPRQALRHAH